MTKTQLTKFFADRPALSPSKIGEEAGYAEGKYLRQCIADDANEELPDRLVTALTPVLKKYGYTLKK
jgi:hypothetical protein